MIAGLMFNRNEGDILEETLTEALKRVDVLFVADDGSTDDSWKIIKSFKGQIEHMQQNPNPKDKGQKQALLSEIQRRYRPEDTWVQVIESDVMIAPFVGNLKEVIAEHSVRDCVMYWPTWNAVRKDWSQDDYPNWKQPITEVLDRAHYFEKMCYTFRPLRGVRYNSDRWRPWPVGFAEQLKGVTKAERYKSNGPVLVHYGYRGPTHFWLKYRNCGRTHPKYKDWILESPETVAKTVPYFNGTWNGDNCYEISREGWRTRKHG